MATQPRHFHRLLAFFDPLFRRPPLVVEPHHGTVVRFQVGHDESYAWEQFAKVELDLRHHAPRRLPTRCLVKKAFVPDHRLVWLGRPTGRVSNSEMSRSRFALAGIRMRYFTPRSSSAS